VCAQLRLDAGIGEVQNEVTDSDNYAHVTIWKFHHPKRKVLNREIRFR
jgi:hypothetical protein